tara:strand:- start:1004 stop:4507 length:3504 start_codon:yes stop_codon:yes gene_type:complete
MAIDFPGSPSNGQRHSHNNTTWEWDGSSWNRITIDLYTTDATTVVGLAVTQFARRDDDNIITGVTTFIGNGYTGVGNTVLTVEGDARITGVLSVGQGSVSINERDISAVGVITGSNFKTGTTNVHNVGVEAAGINVLGADTPIGTGATVYNSGLIVGKKGAEFQGVVTASAFSGDGSGLVGVAATDFVHAQTLQVNGISTFSGVTTVTSETFFSKQGNFTGVVTASSFSGAFVGDGSGLTGVANTDFVHSQTLKVSGISTFSDILVRNITASGITTFEDTKNIDSIGIITARDGIVVSSGTLKADGLVGAAGSVLSSTGSGINWVSPQTGPQGAQGVQGAQGYQGVQGAAGVAGAQGHQGVQGTAGSSGGTGAQGVQGAQGHQGVQGAQGHQGHQGVQGALGAQGNQGVQGATGAAGAQGNQGVQGATNNLTVSTSAPGSPTAGDMWWDSDDGRLGVYYNDGSSSQWVNINHGPAGAQGAQGAQGHQGHQGVQGSVGIASLTISTSAPSSPAQGDMWWDSDDATLGLYYNDGNSSQWVNINHGPSGPQGAQGAQGVQGAQGHQGVQGATGSTGAAGAQGAQGHQGVQGTAGSNATISNNSDNRVITGGSGTNLNGEANLTFNGNTLTVNGDTLFTGNSYNATWDKSEDSLIFGNNTKAAFGSSQNFRIYHDGTTNFLKGVGGDAIEVWTNNTKRFTVQSNGNSLYVDDAKIFFGTGSDFRFWHDGSTNNIWGTGAHELKIATNNTERLRITSGGNVGVNNTSPTQARFVVQQDSGNTAALIKANTGASLALGGVSQPRILLEAASSASNFIVYTAGGSSWGSPSWTERLKIHSTGQVEFKNGSFSNNVDCIMANGGTMEIGAQSTMKFRTATNEVLRINSSGHMCLGSSGSSLNGALLAMGTGVGSNAPSGAHLKLAPSANTISFLDSNSNGSDTGNVRFWNTVYNNCSAKMEMYHPAGNLGGMKFYTHDGSALREHIKIDYNGEVRIQGGGTNVTNRYFRFTQHSTSPYLEINHHSSNHLHTLIYFKAGGSSIGEIRNNSGNVQYYTGSDYRLKENITTLTNAITRLKNLKPSRFNFLTTPSITQDGFIAHELQEVVPTAVTGTKDEVVTAESKANQPTLEDSDIGDPVYQNVEVAGVVPLLTAALQEALVKIETLEAKVAALESA